MTYLPNGWLPPMASTPDGWQPPTPSRPESLVRPGSGPQRNPGLNLAVIGLILGILLGPFGLIGLLFCIGGIRESKAVGRKNPIAVVGIVVSILVFLMSVAGIVGAVMLVPTCDGLDPGIHQVNGFTLLCE